MTQFSIALMICHPQQTASSCTPVDAGTAWTQFEDTKQVQVFQKFVPGSAARDAFAASIHVRCAWVTWRMRVSDSVFF